MRCVDGFPVSADHPNFEVHREIDSDLRSLDQLRGVTATFEMMVPSLSKVAYEQRPKWVEPILERVEWNASQSAASNEKWLNDLSMLAQQCVGYRRRLDISDGTLLRLVKYGHELHGNSGPRMFYGLPETLERSFEQRRAKPLPSDVVRALPRLIDHLIRIHSHSPATYAVAWRYFLEPSANGIGGCFSDRVKRDWMAMPPAERGKWSKLFEVADHHWQAESLVPAKSRKIAKAVADIGFEAVCRRVESWIPDPERNPAEMSGIGMTLLRQMLLWGIAEPKLAVDGALFRLAGVEWTEQAREMLIKEWLGAFLNCLATRDANRAFAIAERMVQNPQLATYRSVREFYELRLEEVSRLASGSAKLGVDGYPLEVDPECAELQIAIDGALRSCVPRHVTAGIDPSTLDNVEFLELQQGNLAGSRSTARQAAIRQAGRDTAKLLRALNARTLWLNERWPREDVYLEGESPWLFWRCEAGYLYLDILRKKPALELPDLIALCDVDRLGFLGVTPSHSIFESCKAHIAKHGFEPKLAEAMRLWVQSLHGSTSVMHLRKKVEWLLWFDPTGVIDEKKCWSAAIRKDLRSAAPEVTAAWMELLDNVSLGGGEKPTQKWLKSAAGLLAKTGPGEFRDRIRAWFAPLRSGQPQRLTVTGRDVLRNLIWYGLVAQDPEVDEAISWFADAKWKTKADAGRMTRILPSFVHAVIERLPSQAAEIIERYNSQAVHKIAGKSYEMYVRHCVAQGRAPAIGQPTAPARPDAEAMKRKMLESMIRPFGGTVVGEEILVNGYRIGISAEAPIVRESDGVRVRVQPAAASAEEDPFHEVALGGFQKMVDLHDLQNPFAPNFMTLSLYTMVLAGGIEGLYEVVEENS